MADEVVPQKTVDALKAAMAARPNPLAPAPAAPVAPATPAPVATAPATPATPPAPAEPARRPDGTFAPKEMSPAEKGLLAAARAEREKRKALEVRLAEYEKGQKPQPAAKVDASSVLSKTDERGQAYWKEVGDPLVRAAINEALGVTPEELQEVIGTVRQNRQQANAETQFRADLQEFVEDMALEGAAVDPAILVDTIRRFEGQHDISLGSTNRKKFENAIGLLGNAPGKPAETPEEVKARADKEALDKARAAGVVPGAQPTAGTPNISADLQKDVRNRAHRGDLDGIAKIIGNRLPKRPAWAQ